jgi:hypothetical protein
MATGLNRQNDTPIGGAEEFRGNMPAGAFVIGDAAVWDGEKFSPAVTTASVRAYGGLASNTGSSHIADGSIINDWDAVLPAGGTPLNTTPDPATGLVNLDLAGTYDVAFSATLTGMANNQEYRMVLYYNGAPRDFGGIIVGSNNIGFQNVSFALSATLAANDSIGVVAQNAGSSAFDVTAGSLSITRIGN